MNNYNIVDELKKIKTEMTDNRKNNLQELSRKLKKKSAKLHPNKTTTNKTEEFIKTKNIRNKINSLKNNPTNDKINELINELTSNKQTTTNKILKTISMFGLLKNNILSIIGLIISVIIIVYLHIGVYKDQILLKPYINTISISYLLKSIIILLVVFLKFKNKNNISSLLNLLFFGFIMIYSIYYFLQDVGDSITEVVFRDALYILAVIIVISTYQFLHGGNILMSFFTQIIMIVFLGGYIIYKLPKYCDTIEHPTGGLTMASILSYLPLLIIFLIWYENKFYCIDGSNIIPVKTISSNIIIYTIIYYILIIGIFFGYMIFTKKITEKEDWITFLRDYTTWVNSNSLILLLPLFFPAYLFWKSNNKYLLYAILIVLAVIFTTLVIDNNIKIFS